MEKKKKVTIYDIAEELNISVGTVNRALHNKARISEETKQKVLETARRMNYKASSAAQGLRRKPINMGILLKCPVRQYRNEIERGINAALTDLEDFNVFGDIRTIDDDGEDPDVRILKVLEEFCSGKYQCVLLFLSEYQEGMRPLIETMRQNGTVIGTVANDILGEESVISVGADGYSAGRLAAEFLHMCSRNTRIAILAGSMNIPIHRQNISGFYGYAVTHPFENITIYEHQDSQRLAVQKTEQMLQENRDIGGIYITSSLSPVICEVIRAKGYAGKLRILATDLPEEIRRFLQDETVSATIFQDPYRQGKDVIKRLYQYACDGQGAGKYLIQPQIIFSSNANLYD